MKIDPIVEEVRRRREMYAAEFDFDLKAMAEDLKKQEAISTRKVVTLRRRRPADESSSAA